MINATVIADSVSSINDVRLITFELEYPRFIHAEFMTHRMFSRNAASSRAIPVVRAIDLICENTAMPIHWGKNQPGMSAREECNETINGLTREETWFAARDRAIEAAKTFNAAGYHKQIVNRLMEPFSHIKVVVTATEWENFFWLREHAAAQPEIHELARVMREAMNQSSPHSLALEEWHTPYFQDGCWTPNNSGGYSVEDALAISVSCCAQVSYRRIDDSLEKAKNIVAKLMSGDRMHASPFEHQATPMPKWREPNTTPMYWHQGITHMDRYHDRWSWNFREWIQHRQLIPGNVRL